MRCVLPVALLWLAWASPSEARAEPCEWSGVLTLRNLEVVGTREVSPLTVEGAPVVVRPPRSGAMHRVEVRASLGFLAETRELPYVIRQRLVTGHGMVSVTRDVPIDRVRAAGDDVTLRVRLPGFTITNLRADCEELVLGRDDSVAPERLEPEELDGTYWSPRTSRLVLHARPGGREVVVMQVPRPRWLAVQRADSRGPWTRVVWTDAYNRVAGWVRTSALRETHSSAWGGTGGVGFGRCAGVGRAGGPDVYQGPAAPRAGALVRDAPRGSVWASVRASEGFVVVQRRGEAWTRIVVAPGVREMGDCALHHAWVRSSEVTLPEDAFSPRASAGREAPSEEVLRQVVEGQPPEPVDDAGVDEALARD